MLRRLTPLLFLISLPGCPSAVEGRGLCRAAQIELQCGIPDDECLAVLNTFEQFGEEHVYTNWRVSLSDAGNCILDVRDLDLNEEVSFDLLEAQPPAALLE